MSRAYQDGRFSRHQITELTGVPSGVLSFWMKQGVLTAVEGGRGKGSHRRFSAMQVGGIALLKELQAYGVSIQHLRAFGSFLHSGTSRIEACGLQASSIRQAIRVSENLTRFKAGGAVQILDYYPETEAASRRSVPRMAKTEQDILDDPSLEYDFDPPEKLAEMARSLVGEDMQALRFAELLYDEVYGARSGEISVILWRDTDGNWEFSASFDDGGDFGPLLREQKSGIYLGLGLIVSSLWVDDRHDHFRRGAETRL